MKIKKPKYKIGDIVVYPDQYFNEKDNSMLTYYQSEIVESSGLLETADKDDEVGWCYHTKHTLEEENDILDESEILFKL